MKFKTLLYKKEKSLLIVNLNRPEKLNAFNQLMLHELLEVFEEVDREDSIHALIISGSGKAFCAGADLSAGKNTFNSEFNNSRDYKESFNRDSGGILALRMYRCLKPILIACNGVSAGIGATLQLPADIRIASSEAKFTFPFAKRGIAPDACSSWFLPKIVGISKALEWSYSGELIDADTAYKAGLVSYLVEHNDLMKFTKKIAQKLIADSSQVSVALTRQMMWTLSNTDSPYKSHEIDSQIIESRGASADAFEGVESFLEKRKAKFPNKISKDMPSIFPWSINEFDEK